MNPVTFWAVIAVLVWAVVGINGQNHLRIRKSWYSLTPGERATFARGVRVMKSLPPTHPNSWYYQANIHGTRSNANVLGWRTCQHGSWFFFPWHRMYLYYFERIMRKATGDPNFNMPYWVSSGDNSIPAEFRFPATPGNPLFTPDRCPLVNAGQHLPPVQTSYERAYRQNLFTAPENSSIPSFGGEMSRIPTHSGARAGSLELGPHNYVHDYIGGPGRGLMSDPNTAAQDPIFWVHHCNVDRIWEGWLHVNRRHQNPVDGTWGRRTFVFFDEFAKPVYLTADQVVNTAAGLGYAYESIPPIDGAHIGAPLNSAQRTFNELRSQQGLIRYKRQGHGYESGAEASHNYHHRVLSAYHQRGVLNGYRHTFDMEHQNDPYHGHEIEGKRNRCLQLHGVTYTRGSIYDVYVNLPADVPNPHPGLPYYVGSLAPFSQGRERIGANGQMEVHGAFLKFDVSRFTNHFGWRKYGQGSGYRGKRQAGPEVGPSRSPQLTMIMGSCSSSGDGGGGGPQPFMAFREMRVQEIVRRRGP